MEGTMGDATADDGMTILDEAECRRLLRGTYVGRVGYVDDGRPVVVPVNYRLTAAGDVAVLTAPGAKLEAAAAGSQLCLQVDEVDPEYRAAWSVLVTGPAQVLDDESEVSDIVGELRLNTWAMNADRTRLILIRADRVEGRRLH
jgi:nitroimidazol reductase NimA-like FMN-containing flavoprotein (pyridoxamine 5'-phosphate oxidase superfamily)